MIVNFLRFRFRDDVTASQKLQALAAIVHTSKMDSVSFSCVGQDLGDPADGFTHSYLVGVADIVSLEKYLRDPIHRQGDFIFIPLLAKLWRSGLSDDFDPELNIKIATAFQRHIADDPEWAELLSGIPDAKIAGR